jgi:hypothetical protein
MDVRSKTVYLITCLNINTGVTQAVATFEDQKMARRKQQAWNKERLNDSRIVYHMCSIPYHYSEEEVKPPRRGVIQQRCYSY